MTPLTLEEILTGCQKEKTIVRKIVALNRDEKNEETSFKFDVQPGESSTKQFRFSRQGNQQAGLIPGDVVFTITEIPHKYFKRNGSDLEFTVTITKIEALNGKIEIPLLREKPISMQIENIKTSSMKKVDNKGLPKSNNSKSRGAILVRFKIEGKLVFSILEITTLIIFL